ncbi:MAG TPA: porin [Nitrospiraceae bacterium]|nr:porin [Nitrospiraceae bacterium]
MRHLRFVIISTVFTGLVFGFIPKGWAVEEGQLQKKDGRWEYTATEDPGLKYLLQKGIITQDEYDKGFKVIETKERVSKPNFNIDVNNGLNIRVGSKFLLKMRLLTQVRYTFSTYNEAWGTVGDSRNPEILGGQVEFRAIRNQSDASNFTVPQAQLQFMGHAFDPDLRYNFSIQLNQSPYNQEGGSGRGALVDAYIASWHIPFATVQVGQQKVWFNRALISSTATSSFADNMLVQRTFAANLVNSRDIGLVVMSDEEKYKFNYAFGIWGGVGPNLTNQGTSVSQALPDNASLPTSQQRTFNYDTRFNNGEMMYTARLLYKVSGNPGYGQGDILYSRVPQVAIGAGYAYNPAQNYLSSIRSDIVSRAYRQSVTGSNNGRLLAGGIYDFQTFEVDLIAKYQGWSLQSEGYYRHQRVRSTDDGSIPFTPSTAVVLGPPVDLGQAWGWYVQVGKYIIPRKLELALRYGVLDPSTKQKDDITKEFGAALTYSFDGTYNNRLIIDYSNLTLGSGGRAPDRFPFESQPGFGRDLVENRINVQYQFYF